MARRQISFKNNERENKLLKAIDESYDKSAFVKECIEFYLDNKGKFNVEENNNNSVVSNIDDWDF